MKMVRQNKRINLLDNVNEKELTNEEVLLYCFFEKFE